MGSIRIRAVTDAACFGAITGAIAGAIAHPQVDWSLLVSAGAGAAGVAAIAALLPERWIRRPRL
ncbi:hypothetical protein [Streptomyces sp. WZ.A104]|uniref:hypothetical protein n=1 Tax=Streptomyces sp. WZ.A104 TaxID=2023771 RepID=UPI001C53DFD2|nr:hypothetical protein [Streptomyces sp. WZ.A104]